MASRVGGGGYAENRGGFGDRTGGGSSRNARDGLGGSGKGGDHNFAADRARMRAAGATTVTPEYGWGQARMSDFGILGGLSNMAKGIYAGNTYAGRTPQGFVGGTSADRNQRLAQQQAAMQAQYGDSPTWRSGLYGGAGGVNYQQPGQGLQYRPKPVAAAAPTGLQYRPQYTQSKFIGDTTPGLAPYGFQSTPWRYVKP